jgi:hypothetical protein
MSGTINLQGPSSGGALIAPTDINAQVNAALATKATPADVGTAVATEAAARAAGDFGAVTATQMRTLPRVSSTLRSWHPKANENGAAPAAINTFSTQWGLESGFDMVRLVYNSPSATGYTIVKAAVYPSSAIGDGFSPLNAAGAADYTMGVPITFNNLGADVAPEDQAVFGTGAASLAVPGNAGSLNRTPFYYSDWAMVSSLDLTDGSALPLLITRHLTDAAGTYQTVVMPLPTAWNAVAQGRVMTSFFGSGDRVGSTMAGGSGISQDVTPIGIQFVTRTPGFSVLLVGDSLTEGAGSSTKVHSWGYLSALALSTPTRPISVWNQGWQGQQSADFWVNGIVAFKACKPDVVTIAVWTPNDGLSQAGADISWAHCMAFANFVMKNGAVPVLMGPCPWSGISTGPQEAARLSARTRMLQAQADGFFVLDWEAALGTGASPNRIQPALLAVDGQHPNDAGNSAMDSAVFRPVLAAILKP